MRNRSVFIHELFETQAEHASEAIAVIYEQAQITYSYLNLRANQLAHHLQKLGVGPEARVGLYMERSLDLLVGLLAILKAGAAYVPLDPLYPHERIAFLIQDAHLFTLVTQQHLVERISPSPVCQTVCLDTAWEHISLEATTNPISQLAPQNLAYIIYTSGSTGQPKGVLVNHQGLQNLVEAEKQAFGTGPADRVLQFASFSFDASLWDILMTLPVGGTLCLLTRETSLSTTALVRYCQEQAITIATLTPSVLQTLPVAKFSMLRTLISVGEACPADLAIAWAEGRRLFNGYGPSEATIAATLGLYSAREQVLSIGHPLPHVQVYLLASDMRQVPAEASGEIHIGGMGVARGYLNHPDLTAASFVPDPFSTIPGARLYKTGDLARTRPNGDLEFIGRVDFQVKIRGQRIELGEIEAALHQHPDVREAVALAREDNPGQKRLVAYVVPQPQRQPMRSVLRRYLQTCLPTYMVPTHFVWLDALPLTSNDKVDRQALPIPDSARPELDAAYVAPRTANEEIIAHIWEDILKLQTIGVYDNFFDLGGHSLAATQIISRLRETFQRELSIRLFFENPTVYALTCLLDDQNLPAEVSIVSPIQRIVRDGNIPLSFAQESIWFLEQLDPQNGSYTARTTAHFTGPLRVSALEYSLNAIIQRHEIFCTTISPLNGQPVQVIHPAWKVHLPVIDLQNCPEHEREAEAQKVTEEILRTRFDTTQLPLAYWLLLRLHPHEHILVQVEHHLVHDGWSFNVLVRELLALYKQYACGQPAHLPELPVQFADFACWQRQWMQGDVAQAQLAYWKHQLAGSPPVLTLPIDYPRTSTQSFRGAAIRFDLPAHICEQLRDLSRQKGVTLFMTMFAAFLTLLHRYSGQDDLCVGTGIANRRWRETEALIGMIINTLVLRVDLKGDPTFAQLLQNVRDVTLSAYAHQDLPFEKVVEALQPKRDLSYNPLFQAIFSFHDAPLTKIDLPELSVDVLGAHSNGSTKFDLNVIAIPRSQQRITRSLAHSELDDLDMTLIWEYSSDLFEHNTILHMAQQYQTLLENILAHPEQRISMCSMLTETERQHILNTWSHTSAPALDEACLHTLFEEQVTLQPDAIALVWADAHLTYHELNLRANRLAHALRDFGVGPEVPVGLYLQRSPDLLVALLAILKAGGVYLPLDPHYPSARLAFLLEDARPRVVLSTHPWIETLPATHGQRIDLETLQATLVSGPTHNLELETSPHNLAAVLYTSGSTGIPKGVGLPHRGMVRLVKDASYAHFTNTETFLHTAPLSFDASTFEIWGSLLNGARLVLSPPEQLSLAELAALLLQQQVTTLLLTTGLFHQMVEYHLSGLRSVRQLLAGGDVLALPTAQTVLRALPTCQLINAYGPTENSTITCCYPLVSTDLRGTSVPIGRPINQTEVYVLDTQMALVPVGVPGELYAGGTGLARGYLGRPDLTAAVFVPHPFSLQPGARLYKTGDQARYRQDGTIEFLGRKDTQVKIRGFRIELAEIEAFLLQQPGVSQAVVVPHEEQADEKYLVAYVVPHADQRLTGDMLRQEMQAQLPAYLVPASCLVLDALPLTANGKLDRRALPTPNVQTLEKQASSVAPRTPTEELLATLWAELLKVERVGVFENFFELGGHSLLATRVISRIQQLFQVNLPLRTLFEHSNVAELALAITHFQGNLSDLSQVSITRETEVHETEELLARLDQLSAEEVDTLLSSMLAEQ